MIMSTFNGCVKELENVLIDNFSSSESHTCFFLSHCHSDHMKGIAQLLKTLRKKHDIYLYCSQISRLILLNKYGASFGKAIKELTSSSVITVPESKLSPSYQMTVTPIPAGHCPGSVMFLFETVNNTVLYTGDFRIASGDAEKFKPLHRKHINKLYFDATFLNEKYWNFPLRSEVVVRLVSLTENWLDKNPNHNVLLITSAAYGYEFVMVELARKLKCKIHVKDSFNDIYWNVPEVGAVLTNDCNITKLHAFCSFDKKCSPCTKQEDLLTIRLSSQWYKSDFRNYKEPIWKKISEQKFLICYSTHCSCSELVEFLNYLHPEEVEPCTSAVGCSEKEKNAYIQQLMQSWPSSKIEEKSEVIKANLPLERNFKFRIKFPSQDEDKQKDFMEFSPEKKKCLDLIVTESLKS